MSPAEEVAYLRALAQRVADDRRFGRLARLVCSAVLDGYATRLAAAIDTLTDGAPTR